MEETRYTVEYSYPDGHELSYDSYGPGTGADLRIELTMDGITQETIHSLFSYGEGEEIYSPETDYYLRLVPVRDRVVVVTWQEPEDGVAAYGPYTPAEAQTAIPKIEPHFVNPASSLEELEDVEDKSLIRTAEQCAAMNYPLGGYLNDDVEFTITTLERP